MIYKINTSVNLKDSNMRKKRNLIALAMISNPLFRNKVEKSTFEKTVKQDQWHRKAKHKKDRFLPNDGLFSCLIFDSII
jgi:stalled ribosome alternative rescue factor ArfA